MSRAADETREGLRMEQVAGIVVARAEGLPLRDVLAQERVEEATFTRAEAAFRELVGADRARLAAWGELVAVAEDCLARPVPPLDRDPRAWGAFSAALGAAPEPAALLARTGLTTNDLSRLRRAWHARAHRDEAVRQAIRDGWSRPSVGDPRPEPPRLQPFPWTPESGGARPAREGWEALADEAFGELPVERDVDVWAALTAALEGFGEHRAMALDLCCLTEAGLARLQERWRERLRADAALRAEFSVRLTDHRSLLASLLP